MGIYIEALILYILLFFSGSAAFLTGNYFASADFSASAELLKIILYYLPSLALIWYLIYKPLTENLSALALFRFGKNDLVSGIITLPGLLIIGTGITVFSSHIDGSAAQISLHSPSTAAEWIILCIICIFSAYLEESYFRYYLLTKRKEFNLNSVSALALSVILFSVCHLYAGPWSFLNAVICAVFLGCVFLRFRSLHGIAIAHAMYNVFAFVLAA